MMAEQESNMEKDLPQINITIVPYPVPMKNFPQASPNPSNNESQNKEKAKI